jgi:hypothetical protein
VTSSPGRTIFVSSKVILRHFELDGLGC